MGDNYQDRKDIDKLNDLIWDTRNGQSKVLDKKTFYAYQQLVDDTYVDKDELNVSLSSKEDTINKVSNWNDTVTDTHYPSEKLVKDSLDDKAPSTHNHTVSDITDFPSIPSKTSDLTNDNNFISTSNTTGLIKNDGSIDQSIYLTSSDITDKEDVSNKVSSWSSNVSDTHYPSEKLVMDTLNRLLNRVSVNADKKNIQKDSTTIITGFKLLNGSPVPNHTLLFYADYNSIAPSPTPTPTLTISISPSSISGSGTATISGNLSCGSGYFVKIYDSNDTLIDTVATGSNGDYTYTTGTLTTTKSYYAVFVGDSQYNSVTSETVTVTVSKITPTILLHTSSSTVNYGDSFILSGTLSVGSGASVKLYNGNTLVDTLPTGTNGTFSKSISANVGSYSYTAVYEGSDIYDSVTSSAVNVTVEAVSVPTYLIFTASKSVLSYYDDDDCTLTAGVFDENWIPISGVEVEFFKGSTSLGTAYTNNSGSAIKEYKSTGAGDLTLKAVYDNGAGTILQETYSIEDCTYYKTTQYTKTSVTLNIPLPSHFSLEYVLKQSNSNYSAPYLDIGASSNNRMLVGQYARAGTNGLITYLGSQTNYPYSSNPTFNQDNTVHFTYDGTDYTYWLNDLTPMTVSDKGVTLSKLIHVEGGDGGYLKNIKIKPL